MSDTIITVENLSKRYKLGTIGATTLRDSVERAWHRLRGRDWREEMGKIGAADRQGARGKRQGAENKRDAVSGNAGRGEIPLTSYPLPPEPSPSDELWALRDVTFEVKRGEVLGVIGRNGAGKSTLLKILTRITEPTSGRAIMRGRVASLLEVGTGFHPELTGRENVYLNGAILGMKRAEITQKFDEIVAFAEVEKFIDTPVKRYSSGMYVRLAFAVAAHLEPEILLVDEVLAVGDAAFQKRCLGKMKEVAGLGRTVLFVSHNMAAIATLCPRSILLHAGDLKLDGNSADVVSAYYDEMAATTVRKTISGTDNVVFLSARIVNSMGEGVRATDVHESFSIEMNYRVNNKLDGIIVPNFHFYTATGVCCFAANPSSLKPYAPTGDYVARCNVPAHLMNEGTFSIGVAATSYFGDRYVVDFYEQGLLFLTVRDPKIPDEHNYGYAQTLPGILHPRFEWSVIRR